MCIRDRTQTALLHVQGEIANRERIRKFLSIYQSSSPSYVLMASIDACVCLLYTSYTANDRILLILLELYQSEEFVKSYYLAYLLNVSAGTIQRDLEAVSYTHLDVYKRKVRSCLLTALWRLRKVLQKYFGFLDLMKQSL